MKAIQPEQSDDPCSGNGRKARKGKTLFVSNLPALAAHWHRSRLPSTVLPASFYITCARTLWLSVLLGEERRKLDLHCLLNFRDGGTGCQMAVATIWSRVLPRKGTDVVYSHRFVRPSASYSLRGCPKSSRPCGNETAQHLATCRLAPRSRVL